MLNLIGLTKYDDEIINLWSFY